MPTLNERALELCDAMVVDADELGVVVSKLRCGTRLIDCGVGAAGSVEAGRRLAEVCLSDLGSVEILPEKGGRELLTLPGATGYDFGWFDPQLFFPSLHTKHVYTVTHQPVAACMASQYAGWKIIGDDYFAMGSGPMRAAAGREELFDVIGHRERAYFCVGVLETNKLPPENVCIDIAAKCGIAPDQLTLLVARTASIAGTLQIVARSVETALHKLHELGFDLGMVEFGFGVAPLPPIAGDDLTAIGWTNDAILYGALVGLVTHADDRTIKKIKEIGPRVPSSASPDYGRPFAEIFARYDRDFYRIDPMLFSPALIMFGNLFTSRGFRYGRLAPEVLAESFGKE